MHFESKQLKYQGRSFRTRNGKLLFGPAGMRLFIDYLDKAPGFSGRIDFIHKLNLTEIFTIETNLDILFREAETIWYPDHLYMGYENGLISFDENKFITENDIAVSVQNWENKSRENLILMLRVNPDRCTVEDQGTFINVLTPKTNHGYQAFYLVQSESFGTKRKITVSPGENLTLVISAAFGNMETETMESVRSKIQSYLKIKKNPQEYLKEQERQYSVFYKDIPEFNCDSELLNHLWNYRWYIMNNTYAEPAYGNYKHGVMYEGRSHKMGKTPFVSEGWEFSKLIPLSTPLHITDMQWRSDTYYVEQMIASLLDSQDQEGFFRVMTTNAFGAPYANYSLWAIYQFVIRHKDAEYVQTILRPLKRFIDAHEKNYSSGKDSLQIETIHQRTGKEYQPSYWYFHDYPEDCRNRETYTYLKRVDRSVYHYLNLKGIAGLCRICKDSDETFYEEKAKRIASEINGNMWDEQTSFYYDLHYQTDEKAYVKNIVGYYPFWAEITNKNQLKALYALTDEKEFGTSSMYPSVSKSCPAYAPAGGWMGNFIKGRDGCVWNGPSWPYTNGIILDMLGKQSKKNGHAYDKLFREGFYRYVFEHFRDDHKDRPYLVEHYNPETGELLSDEADYNHSFCIHLIMEHILGIKVEADKIVIDPVNIGLRFFGCTGIRIRNHELDIEYKENYFTVKVDGEKYYKGLEIAKVEIRI